MLRKSFAVMALVLLSACSGDPEPREPAPSPSASPTATPPDMPELANEESDEGAFGFATHFIESMNYSVNSGVTEPLTALSSKSCESCRSYIETIQSDAQHGTTVRGFRWTIANGSVDNDGAVDLRIDADEYEIREFGDADWSRVESARYELGLSLKYGSSGWTVMEMYLPEASE